MQIISNYNYYIKLKVLCNVQLSIVKRKPKAQWLYQKKRFPIVKQKNN